MGQSDIYEALKNKRLSGDDSYFNSREIMAMLNGKGISINLSTVQTNLVQLRMFGYLDTKIEAKKVKRITYPFILYRLKKEYIN